MNRPPPHGRARFGPALLLPLLAALVLPASVAVASDVCASATIEEPFLLPTGELHPPARLTLCERGSYSGASSFHEVKVDGASVARLISRRESSEAGPAEGPFLMFVRKGDGHLTLLGYAYPSRDGMQAYAFGPAAERVAVLARPTDTQSRVLVAARVGTGERSAR